MHVPNPHPVIFFNEHVQLSKCSVESRHPVFFLQCSSLCFAQNPRCWMHNSDLQFGFQFFGGTCRLEKRGTHPFSGNANKSKNGAKFVCSTRGMFSRGGGAARQFSRGSKKSKWRTILFAFPRLHFGKWGGAILSLHPTALRKKGGGADKGIRRFSWTPKISIFQNSELPGFQKRKKISGMPNPQKHPSCRESRPSDAVDLRVVSNQRILDTVGREL